MRAAKLADLANRFANNKYGRPGCSWTRPPSATQRAGLLPNNSGLIWTGGILLRIRFSLPVVVRSDQAVMLTDMNQQARRLICARICARGTAGLAEMGETQKARDDFMSQVC